MARARQTAKRTRIQEVNERRILEAALESFSRHGYRGATIDGIARLANMSKPNLLYYFGDKQSLYSAVLTNTLETWLDPLEHLDPEGEPLEEIWHYVELKLEMSRTQPSESRLFAMEVLQGAPVLGGVLETRLKALVANRIPVIDHWIKTGRLASVDPLHLLFLIWAMTQTYADFWSQIALLSEDRNNKTRLFAKAKDTLRQILIGGLTPPADS